MRTTERNREILPKDKESKTIEGQIDIVLAKMDEVGVDAPEYDVMMNHLDRLTEINTRNRRRISPDTLVLVAGNLFGIILIIAFEEKHVITSRGLNLLVRPK
jgi:hypothetical protein